MKHLIRGFILGVISATGYTATIYLLGGRIVFE